MADARGKKPKVTVEDLLATFKPGGSFTRHDIFDRYAKQKPTSEAIPVLRRGLFDEDKAVAIRAANALKKLGPLAVEAVDDLFKAAEGHLVCNMPQAYPDCIEALAAIAPHDSRLLPFIDKCHAFDNWVPITASLRALKLIGTPAALEIFDKIARLFDPKFSKTQRRIVTELRQF